MPLPCSLDIQIFCKYSGSYYLILMWAMIATPIENLKNNGFSWRQEWHTLIIKAKQLKFNIVILYKLYTKFFKDAILIRVFHLCYLWDFLKEYLIMNKTYETFIRNIAFVNSSLSFVYPKSDRHPSKVYHSWI